MDAPAGVIKLDWNLAAVEYGLNEKTSRVATERCPTGAIVWFETPNKALKGAAAKRIVRNEALPLLNS
jgi:hypothetical protein